MHLRAAVLGLKGGEVATLVQVAMMGDLPWPALRDAAGRVAHRGICQTNERPAPILRRGPCYKLTWEPCPRGLMGQLPSGMFEFHMSRAICQPSSDQLQATM